MPPGVFKLSRVLNLLKPLAVFLLIVPHKSVRVVAAQLARHAPRPGVTECARLKLAPYMHVDLSEVGEGSDEPVVMENSESL
jgi:hypothetical protein